MQRLWRTSEAGAPVTRDRPEVALVRVIRLATDVHPCGDEIDTHAHPNGHDGNEAVAAGEPFTEVKHMDTRHHNTGEQEGGHGPNDTVGYGEDDGSEFPNHTKQEQPHAACNPRVPRCTARERDDAVVLCVGCYRSDASQCSEEAIDAVCEHCALDVAFELLTHGLQMAGLGGGRHVTDALHRCHHVGKQNWQHRGPVESYRNAVRP